MHIYFLTQKQNSPAYITPNISSSPPSQPAEVCGLCGVTCGRVPARPSVTGWAVVMLRDSLLANTRNLSFLRMVYSCKVPEENEFWDIQRKLWLGGKHPRVESSGRAVCKSKRSVKSFKISLFTFRKSFTELCKWLAIISSYRCFLPFLLFRQEAITREVPTIMSFWPRGRTINLSDQHTITQSSVGNVSVPWEIIMRREKKLGKWHVQHVGSWDYACVCSIFGGEAEVWWQTSEALPTIWGASPPGPPARETNANCHGWAWHKHFP